MIDIDNRLIKKKLKSAIVLKGQNKQLSLVR